MQVAVILKSDFLNYYENLKSV